MAEKYNLALMPQTKSDEFVCYAQKFSHIADKYLLGVNSLPHITLYQFEAGEKDITAIWVRVCQEWKEKSIDLEFNNFSCITFDNDVYWVSILPNNRDILLKMHIQIASIISLPIKNTFDPHLTLINSKNKDYEKEVTKLSAFYSPIIDKFTLTLGRSDNIGQLTEIVHVYDK